MALKTIDEKGRLTLGRAYAGKLVTVEEYDDGRVQVQVCKAVPEREAWLWENPTAITSVQRGLMQAETGQVDDGPDLEAAFAEASEIPDDDGE